MRTRQLQIIQNKRDKLNAEYNSIMKPENANPFILELSSLIDSSMNSISDNIEVYEREISILKSIQFIINFLES